MFKKLLLILNPNSGLKAGKKKLADILDVFCRNGYICTVYITAFPGDATEKVANAKDDYDLVVCVGGDGTFNEVVAGVIASRKNTPIGYIPAGSTNDFANSLKLPKNMVKVAESIVNGIIENIDTGSFNGRTFTYVASFGAFTKASYSTPQNVKNALGHLAYVLQGIKEIGSIKPISMKLIIDDNEVIEGNFIFGAVSNSTSIAGLLTLDEELVDLSDGKLELLLVKSPKNIIELNECIAALTTKNFKDKMLIFKSVSKLDISADSSVDWTLDGEMQAGSNKIIIQNKHNSINLLLNRKKNK